MTPSSAGVFEEFLDPWGPPHVHCGVTTVRRVALPSQHLCAEAITGAPGASTDPPPGPSDTRLLPTL